MLKLENQSSLNQGLVEELHLCGIVATLPDGGYVALCPSGGFSVSVTTTLRHAWLGLCVVHE